MRTEADILYENGDFWIAKNKRGDYEIYRNGLTHATLHATVGRNLTNAWERAKAECDRRAAQS